MNMNDLNGCTVKLGKTSITAKTESGKTAGIVTRIQRLSDAPPRVVFDFHKMINPARHAGKLDRLYVDGKDVFYLYDLNKERTVNERPYLSESFAPEIERDRALRNELCKNGVTVISVYLT